MQAAHSGFCASAGEVQPLPQTDAQGSLLPPLVPPLLPPLLGAPLPLLVALCAAVAL